MCVCVCVCVCVCINTKYQIHANWPKYSRTSNTTKTKKKRFPNERHDKKNHRIDFYRQQNWPYYYAYNDYPHKIGRITTHTTPTHNKNVPTTAHKTPEKTKQTHSYIIKKHPKYDNTFF